MPLITYEDFQRWSEVRATPSVSIYQPTHQRGPDIEQDPIRLKNAITEIEQQLKESGLRRSSHRQLLDSLRGVVDNREFWRHQQRGLALLATDGDLETVQLPYEVSPLTLLADRFHLRPLLPGLEEHEMVLLVLSTSEVRMFRATEAGLGELQYDGPRSADDVNWFVDRENQVRLHPIGRGKEGFHGEGADRWMDADRERFLVAVADAAAKAVREVSGPTMVMAVNELQAQYRRVADHDLTETDIHGNFDGVGTTELWEACRSAVSAHADRIQEEEDSRARAAIEQGTAVVGVVGVLETAITGRAARVVLHPEADPIWGRYTPERLDTTLHEEHRQGDVDLLDACAREALATGATVKLSTAVPPEDGVAAVPRF